MLTPVIIIIGKVLINVQIDGMNVWKTKILCFHVRKAKPNGPSTIPRGPVLCKTQHCINNLLPGKTSVHRFRSFSVWWLSRICFGSQNFQAITKTSETFNLQGTPWQYPEWLWQEVSQDVFAHDRRLKLGTLICLSHGPTADCHKTCSSPYGARYKNRPWKVTHQREVHCALRLSMTLCSQSAISSPNLNSEPCQIPVSAGNKIFSPTPTSVPIDQWDLHCERGNFTSRSYLQVEGPPVCTLLMKSVKPQLI